MKKLLLLVLVLTSFTFFAQTKKFEAVNKTNGKSVLFEEGQRTKITTLDRKKMVGSFSVKDNQTITIDGAEVKINNIASIKHYPKGGRKVKNILFGTSAGLLATSGVLAAGSNESAVAVFAGGVATAAVGALVNNKNKNLSYRHHQFQVIE